MLSLQEQYGAAQGIDVGRRIVQDVSLLGQLRSLGNRDPAIIAPAILCVHPVGPGHKQMGCGVFRIERYGLAKQAAGAEVLRLVESVEALEALAENIPGLQVVGLAAEYSDFLAGRQFDAQRRSDAVGDVVLNREEIVGGAVIALGPEVAAVESIDELGVDA
jgi:hypothetical protein